MEDLLCYRAKLTVVGLWSLLSLPFGFVILGGIFLVIWCGLDMGCVGSRASWKMQARVSHCL